MRFFQRNTFAVLYFITVPALLISAGCGSGSGNVPVNSPPNASGTTITRENDATFSDDAKILTARQATVPFLSASIAAGFDADLAKIRTAYPQLKDIHARPDFVLTDVVFGLKKNTTFIDNWKKGNLKTGEAALDKALAQYDAVSIERPLDFDETIYFLVKLGHSVNVPALIPVFKNASTSLSVVEANGIGGDGDQLTYASDASGTKTYTFSVGSGDCPGGCINRHFYIVTLSPGGALALSESSY